MIKLINLHLFLLELSWLHDKFDRGHFYALTVAQFLVSNEGHELHHFAMALYLRHVLFDGELLALEKARLLPLVHIEGAKRVHEHVCPTVMLVPFNH